MRLSPPDNVAVALRTLKAGEIVHARRRYARHPQEHRGRSQARRARDRRGELIVKYGCPIGTATAAIDPGEHLHAGNVETGYLPTFNLPR